MLKMKKVVSLLLITALILSSTAVGLADAGLMANGIYSSVRINSYGTEISVPGTNEPVRKFTSNVTVGENGNTYTQSAVNIHNDDSNVNTGRKLSEIIAEFEVMIPENAITDAYFQLRTSKLNDAGTAFATYKTYNLIQINRNGIVLREGLNDLGCSEEIPSGGTALYSSDTGAAYRTLYNTWSKIRIVFSATQNCLKIYYKDEPVKIYTFDESNEIIDNIWKANLGISCSSQAPEDLGIYFKNSNVWYTFNDASEADRLTLAQETGDYAYTYDDGSGVFDYTISFSGFDHFATITGFKDADYETEGYQLPEGSEFTIPYYIDGCPVTKIGDYAFSKNDSNENVKADSELTDGRYVNIQKINMPDCVEAIGNYAFFAMHGVKEITLPANLTSIGDYAFYHNFSVDEIKFNDNLESIGAYAFQKLGNMANAFTGTLVQNAAHRVDRVDLPESCTSIAKYAFNNSQVNTFVVRGDVTLGVASFMWLKTNELIFLGNAALETSNGEVLNPFSEIKSGAYRTGTYRASKLYCTGEVFETLTPHMTIVATTQWPASPVYYPAWIDKSDAKVYLAEGKAIAFTAFYNKDGSLASVSESALLSAGEYADITLDSQAYKTKVFVWESFTTCKPIIKNSEM